MIVFIALVSPLVTGLIGFLVFFFLKVPFLEVVPVMRAVILAVPQALIVFLVFRIILVVSLLLC
jgi:hypothetical protein